MSKKTADNKKKTYIKHCGEPWFSLIKLGLKKVEGRLFKGDFADMKKGDTLTLMNSDFNERKFNVKITGVVRYTTFREYLETETIKKALPGMDDIDDALSVYYKYFKEEDEKIYGVACIRIKLLSNN